SDDPKDWPERGTVLSMIELQMMVPDRAQPVTISLREVFADHVAGPFDPLDSLRNTKDGFGAYPKLFGPRWAVFVPEQAVNPPTGARFVLTLKMENSTAGGQATPIRRFALSASRDSRWQKLINSSEHLKRRSELQLARKSRAEIKGLNLPVMRERPEGAERPTHVFVRGNRLDRGEKQEPSVPSIIPGLESDAPNRLDMARWLTSPENPLTARVFANRLWAELFGTGLVETQEDFGSTGTAPSHPALLDHLALQLRDDHGWRIKAFLRELVLSATYRQTNRADSKDRERDPDNRLLARGPSTRLTAEMIRDQALMISGLLSDKRFGPPVMPPQPEGVWQTVYSGAKWQTPKEGPDRYRRALYTYWRRTSPYPSFLIFDAPTREVCTPRRISTNTPLHALVTLNDPVYLECAQAFAKRMREEGGTELRQLLAWGLEQSTQQKAKEAHVDTLLALYRDAALSYQELPDETHALADSPENAALVLVANTILNLDAATKK
ncbi:MAG: DUF1553 domain-containing protein, partial [Verrucomicrobiota bacterium]